MHRILSFAPAVLIALGGLFFVCAYSLWPDTASGRLTAVYPPWWSSRDAFLAASAGGAVVSVGRLPFVVGVRGSDGFDRRLRRHGAILVLSGSLAEICGANSGVEGGR